MPQNSVSRRDLAKHLALGTGAAMFGLSGAGAEDETPAAETSPAETPDAPSPLDLQMAWLFDRYPSEHLTEDQIAAIRRDVRRRLTQSASLRSFPLDQTDAPALVFAAYRAAG